MEVGLTLFIASKAVLEDSTPSVSTDNCHRMTVCELDAIIIAVKRDLGRMGVDTILAAQNIPAVCDMYTHTEVYICACCHSHLGHL